MCYNHDDNTSTSAEMKISAGQMTGKSQAITGLLQDLSPDLIRSGTAIAIAIAIAVKVP